MLNANDVHRIVGLIYVATGKLATVVKLGEKVADVASGTRRDVDIVILTAGSMATIGTEVKHEARPLDTVTVEGLCLKLNDMPSITDRSIVSSSGFTEPAVAKARSHGVRCLSLRRGPLRKMGSIDISQMSAIGYIATCWRAGPQMRIYTDPPFPIDLKGRLVPSLRVRYVKDQYPTVPLAVLSDRMVSEAISLANLPDDESDVRVAVRINITDNPFITVSRRRYRITQVEITGVAAKESGNAPLNDVFTLQDEAGQPFAGAAIAEIGDLLIGICTATGGNHLHLMVLTAGVRQLRPTKACLSL